jgi:tripartite ATP-independent transporter DctP family solute receptor
MLIKSLKGFGFLASVLLFFCLTSLVYAESKSNCSPRIVKPQVIIRLGTAFAPGHILSDFSDKFKEIVERKSYGLIEVRVAAGFATEEKVNILTKDGFIDMQATGGEPIEEYAPQYFFFNAPYVIKDYAHFLRVWNGPLGKEAKKLVAANGKMLALGTVYRGLRQMTSNKPIYSPLDLVGLKLRLPVVPTWIAVWETLETEPVPIPLTELYAALADGRAEASEGDLPQISSFKLNEIQNYLSITNHLVAIGWIMINKSTYDNLNYFQKKIVIDSANEASAWATQKTLDNEANLLDQLQSQGMIVIYPDADAIRQKAKPTVEELFKTQWPVTTWEEVLAQ